MTRDEFIAQLAQIAVRLRVEGSPLFPSVRLAQNVLETGGEIHKWNNLGGIKVGRGKPNQYWKGAIINKGTWEVYDGQRIDVTATFRAYETIYDFYKDQDLLFRNHRYDRVRASQSWEEQVQALAVSG